MFPQGPDNLGKLLVLPSGFEIVWRVLCGFSKGAALSVQQNRNENVLGEEGLMQCSSMDDDLGFCLPNLSDPCLSLHPPAPTNVHTCSYIGECMSLLVSVCLCRQSRKPLTELRGLLSRDSPPSPTQPSAALEHTPAPTFLGNAWLQ